MALILAIGALLLTAASAQAQSIDKIWSWRVGSTYAGLSMQYNDGGQPSHVWFDYGTDPRLAHASRAGEDRNNAYGSAQSHATLSGLRPNTVYYFRATISTPYGRASSGIQSFRTAAAGAPRKPTVRFLNLDNMVEGNRPYMMFNFAGEGYGLAGQIFLLWSTDPHLAHAARVDGGGIVPGPAGTAVHPRLFTDGLGLADGATIYYQGVIETAAGRAATPIMSVRYRKPNMNY